MAVEFLKTWRNLSLKGQTKNTSHLVTDYMSPPPYTDVLLELTITGFNLN
jgi:hypothetical protein